MYGDYSGIALSTMTHMAGTPWDIVWNRRDGKDRMNVVIPNNIIREFYRQKAISNELTGTTPIPAI